MHRDDEDTPLEETLSTMARLIELGKIRYYGVSNFRAWRVARLVETARRMGVPPPIACQPTYNAMTRGIETELLPCCAHYGIGVVVYSPLARGVLTGSTAPAKRPSPAAVRHVPTSRLMQSEYRAESLRLSQTFKAHAEARGLHAEPARDRLGAQQPARRTASSAVRARSRSGRTTSAGAHVRVTRRGRDLRRRSGAARPRLHPRLHRSGLSGHRARAAHPGQLRATEGN